MCGRERGGEREAVVRADDDQGRNESVLAHGISFDCAEFVPSHHEHAGGSNRRLPVDVCSTFAL